MLAETALARPAGSMPEADLVLLALDGQDWSHERALALNVNPAAAVDRLRAMMIPLREVEPHGVVRDTSRPAGFRFEGKWTPRLADALRPLGIKIAPTMSAEQSGAWLAAMVSALSDLPPRVGLRAATETIHVPLRFANEVETAVREQAKGVASRYRVAIIRLQQLERAIAEAAKPKLPPPPDVPPTPEELAAMASTEVGRTLLRVGVASGIVTQDQMDAAMASQAEGAEA